MTPFPPSAAGTEQVIWVEDESEAWVRARVTATNEDGSLTAQDESSGATIRVSPKDSAAQGFSGVPLANDLPEAGVHDMCDLSFLHEPAILHNLRVRFAARPCQPYTYVGFTCLAVNPCTWNEAAYDDATKQRYLAHGGPLSQLPPHVYAVSAAALRDARSLGTPQSILVSGESGAGKTETTKLILRHLAHGEAGRSNERLLASLLACNPILEAFGNAKTRRNANSSRFGRYLSLHYTGAGNAMTLAGASTRTYLLERSRVTAHPCGERSYHVFYQLLLGASHDQLARWGAADMGAAVREDPTQAARWPRILQPHAEGSGAGGDTALSEAVLRAEGSESWVSALHRTLAALRRVGVSDAQVDGAFATLAAILRLGDIGIAAAESEGGVSGAAADEEALASAASLLGVSPQVLGEAMTAKTVAIAGEEMRKPLSVAQAEEARDALAKALYAALFDWLVARMNEATAPAGGGEEEEEGAPSTHIALLDIFGFECFPENGFEQLCINYANEKLQQQYVRDVLAGVEAEYEHEGIAWEGAFTVPDNAPVVALLEGKQGLVSLLREQCLCPRPSDAAFVRQLARVHGDHPAFSQPRVRADTRFTVRHYAADVTYAAEGFLARSRDTLPDALRRVVVEGTAPFAASLLPPSPPNASTGKGRRGSALAGATVGEQFRSQLGSLLREVAATRVQYIRCIKPNPTCSPGQFDGRTVCAQLRCLGVLAAVRVARAAYPNAMHHEQCLQRFAALLPAATRDALLFSKAGDGADSNESTAAAADDGDNGPEDGTNSSSSPALVEADAGEDARPLSVSALRQFWAALEAEAESEGAPPGSTPAQDGSGDGSDSEDADTVAVGRTRVYFAAGVLERLEARLSRVHAQACTVLQAAVRGWLLRQRCRRQARAATALQAWHRAASCRRAYLRARAATITLQRLQRGRAARVCVQGMRRDRAARRVTRCVRRGAARRRMRLLRHSAVQLQRCARGVAARRWFRAALVARREEQSLTGRLTAAERRAEAAEARVAELEDRLAAASSGVVQVQDATPVVDAKKGAEAEAELARAQAAESRLSRRCADLEEENALLRQGSEAKRQVRDLVRLNDQLRREANEAQRKLDMVQRVAGKRLRQQRMLLLRHNIATEEAGGSGSSSSSSVSSAGPASARATARAAVDGAARAEGVGGRSPLRSVTNLVGSPSPRKGGPGAAGQRQRSLLGPKAAGPAPLGRRLDATGVPPAERRRKVQQYDDLNRRVTDSRGGEAGGGWFDLFAQDGAAGEAVERPRPRATAQAPTASSLGSVFRLFLS